MRGTRIATRPFRLSRRLKLARSPALAAKARPTRRGTISIPAATGTTCPARATCGRLMTPLMRGGIRTGTETGCTRRAMDTSGHRAIHGAICRISADCGITTTALAGGGHRAWAAASLGGRAACMAGRDSGHCRVAIAGLAGLSCPARRRREGQFRWSLSTEHRAGLAVLCRRETRVPQSRLPAIP